MRIDLGKMVSNVVFVRERLTAQIYTNDKSEILLSSDTMPFICP